MAPTRARRADAETVIRIAEDRGAISISAVGEFECRTVCEARRLAAVLARFYPDPDRVEIGLAELLINAVEHGNLGITYEEKAALLARGGLGHEIERRASRPELAARRVRAKVWQTADRLVTAIADEGAGFDWRAFLDGHRTEPDHANGRGLMIAREFCFDRVMFNELGNVVTAEVELTPVSRTRIKGR
jgi:anti-sigma regulatory factor (Ser/Thr protein kinase)